MHGPQSAGKSSFPAVDCACLLQLGCMSPLEPPGRRAGPATEDAYDSLDYSRWRSQGSVWELLHPLSQLHPEQAMACPINSMPLQENIMVIDLKWEKIHRWGAKVGIQL